MKYTTGDFQYTPLLRSFGEYILYVIKMTDVLIDGKSIGVDPSVYSRNQMGGCVVDSGTNILLLPSDAFAGIKSTVQSNMCPSSVPVRFTQLHAHSLVRGDVSSKASA